MTFRLCDQNSKLILKKKLPPYILAGSNRSDPTADLGVETSRLAQCFVSKNSQVVAILRNHHGLMDTGLY
jgi:hypothetical protein